MRIDIGDFSSECFHTDYATEIGRIVFIHGWKSINGSVEWLGVSAPFYDIGVDWTEKSWFPIHVGETDVDTNVGLWQLALDLNSEEEAFLGVARSLSAPITFLVVQKMCAQGRDASVTFPCWRTVWCGLKLSCTTSTLALTSRVFGRTTA